MGSEHEHEYRRQYYLDNKDTILPNIRQYNKDKYDNNLEYKLLKRYESRVDNYFGTKKYKAEDLLHCSPSFFGNRIKWCLRDLNRSRQSWSDIEIHHVRPVTSFNDDDLSEWNWTNTLPQTETENLQQAENRYPEEEKKQINIVFRYLKSIDVDGSPEGSC
jgi:hypothetical protein